MNTEIENTTDPVNEISPDSVAVAFRYLEEAIEFEKGRLDEEGAHAMHHGDYATVTAVMEFAARLHDLANDAGAVFEKWRALGPLREPLNQRVRDHVSKSPLNRRIGTASVKKNPEFCRHILNTLVDMGGTAVGAVVIDGVRSKVSTNYQQLQGARALIGRLGLVKGIKGKSGLWTITKAGTDWLEENPLKD
ncbi:MAG: hypothetical protein V4689_10785 [Verrucomicrobiota bacterium]